MCSSRSRRSRRRAGPAIAGFTLIELLVVLAILTLLIALLLPMIGRARARSRQVACQAQLHDLGAMMQLYLHDNRQRVMRVNPLPSDPNLLKYAAPSIVEVLAPYHRGATKIFRCPADHLLNPSPTTIAKGGDTYFDCEGTSYEYNVFFNAYALDEETGLNRIYADALSEAKRRPPLMLEPTALPLLVDFEAFHGKKSAPTSRNALYADFHVGELELGLPQKAALAG